MADAIDEMPLPNDGTAVGLVPFTTRTRIDPVKPAPFSTFASTTSLIARGRSRPQRGLQPPEPLEVSLVDVVGGSDRLGLERPSCQ